MKCATAGCDNGPEFGLRQCRPCLNKAKARAAERYERIKQEKRCKSCPNLLGSARGIYCKTCREKRYARYQKRREKGLCTKCGKKKATKGMLCFVCYTNRNQTVASKTARRIANGCCRLCDEKKLEGNTLCLRHYLKFTSRSHFKNSKMADALNDLFIKQDGICPYTKRKLTLGKDASLDHIIPKSRGGTNDISNLQWVHYQANFMKQDMLEEEFLALVCEIAKNRCTT